MNRPLMVPLRDFNALDGARERARNVLDEFEAAHNGFHLDHNDYVEWIGKVRTALSTDGAPLPAAAPKSGETPDQRPADGDGVNDA